MSEEPNQPENPEPSEQSEKSKQPDDLEQQSDQSRQPSGVPQEGSQQPAKMSHAELERRLLDKGFLFISARGVDLSADPEKTLAFADKLSAIHEHCRESSREAGHLRRPIRKRPPPRPVDPDEPATPSDLRKKLEEDTEKKRQQENQKKHEGEESDGSGI